ncbi:MAG TPA: bifunctional proline dehydrogenase/L-glutamate gamma-semialdehyde dehydrogenase PutA [Moraxellaceae bacterium]|nr:bifunctional proline dehydrogenase/L-glutamate gamma-semialdehyde dehydrogenase PutA [Moraxellaceae bacterium]
MTPLLQDLPDFPYDFSGIREWAALDEGHTLERLLPNARLASAADPALALRLVEAARRQPAPPFNDFLANWRLSSEEGRALLTLAEALLRIPDLESANQLINDLVVKGEWGGPRAEGGVLVKMAALGLSASKRFIQEESRLPGAWHALLLRMGDSVFRRAISAALVYLAGQFLLGEDMPQALERRRPGRRYSFDRLGEAAQTFDDTERYLKAYRDAISALSGQSTNLPLLARDGISIKLSALHPRFEFAQWARLQKELLPRLRTLSELAAEAGIPITLDAEEAERLEITLAVYSEMARLPALRNWGGLGLAIQAYQKRAPAALDFLARIAAEFHHPVPVRLVKGAYWDTEIKRAQQLGLAQYPVYTRKRHTDIAYLACARLLLENTNRFYPQFATHNAQTLASVEACAKALGADYEVQKLTGMGDTVHDAFHAETGRPVRIYAPVGRFETLLPYLVRRMLENGSSQSFVNQLADKSVEAIVLAEDPLAGLETPPTPHPRLPLPRDIYGNRPLAPGFDPADAKALEGLAHHLPRFPPIEAGSLVALRHGIEIAATRRTSPAHPQAEIGHLRPATSIEVGQAFLQARHAFGEWSEQSPGSRAHHLRKLARQLERARDELIGLLIREAGKTVMDALAEWREAVDFCHYYAGEAERLGTAIEMPSVTGERNRLTLHGRGVFLCISPWNFPLAIFLGQIAAALAAGNTVIAKPANQTPLIAFRTIELAYAAGIPRNVLQLLPGSSATLGPAMLSHPLLAGVAFTGSASVATDISRTLAAREGARLPLIAETGGLNVMIADSTALPEQLATDVITSAFTSAGQRCSALRVLWLQEDIKDRVLARLEGMLAEWRVGPPGDFRSDMGPLIDAASRDHLDKACEALAAKAIWQATGRIANDASSEGHFLAPRLFLLPRDALPLEEIFGPVLCIATWEAGELPQVMDWVNANGYGLTLGIHTRIQSTMDYVIQRAAVGNIYLNRNQIGAVVGCQPFGGEGLSGTGFKAGGPHYLLRFMTERTVTTNLAALGINTGLLDL